MPIIYEVVFDCELCGKPQTYPVYGKSAAIVDDELIQSATEHLRLAHWTQKHLNCAVCGKRIELQEMELAYNDGSVTIHEDYTDYYSKVKLGDKRLLHVHPSCLNASTVA